jgi:tetratricopeptide (TPR) repeat protein
MAYQSEIEKLEQRFGEKPEQWFAALADAYRKDGDLDMALDILNTWIEKRPNYTSGHIVRGRCLLDREQDPEAAQAFQGVLELDPENIIAIKALSDIAARAGNEEQTRHWLERLLEVDPMNEEAHAALEAMSQPDALEPAELEAAEPEPAEAPPAEETAAGAPARASGPEAAFDPMAIADEMRDSDEVEEVTEEPAREKLDVPSLEVPALPDFDADEATLEMEPTARPPTAEPELQVEAAPEVEGLTAGQAAPVDADMGSEAAEPEPTVEPAAEVEGLETSEVRADAGDAAVDDSGLKVEAFDEEMGWDAGDRVSHAISQEDIEEAQQAHENSLDSPAHVLPGIEEEEVPEVGVEEREAPAVEGLDLPPEAPEEEPEPVTGFEPTVAETADGAEEAPPEAAAPEAPVEAEVVAQAEPEPEPAPEPAEPEPTPVPAAAAPEPEEEEEEELPLILPEDVRAEEEEEEEPKPEPLVTETMAEVYVAQGHHDQARDIYRKLLAQQPGNAALAAKLADLESRATPVPAAPPSLEQRFAAAATGHASVSVVLAEILGTDPQPAIAPPPRPAGAELPRPAVPVAPAPAAAPPMTPPDEDFSFDEFFGGESPEGGSEPSTRDDDFRHWLKSLKT